MVCATQSLENAVREGNAAAEQARAAARTAQRKADVVRRHEQAMAEGIAEREAAWAAMDAEEAARVAAEAIGQIDELATLRTPSVANATDLLKLAGRRYRHLPGWAAAEQVLRRFDEQAAEGEQAVAVSGGTVFLGADTVGQGVVLVSTHGLTWCCGEADPVRMPYSVTTIEAVELAGSYDGVAFRASAGGSALTVMPDGTDQAGALAMLRAKGWAEVSRITPRNDAHRGMLADLLLDAPASVARYAPMIAEVAGLVDGRTILQSALDFSSPGWLGDQPHHGLWLITDEHLVSTDRDGSLRVDVLAEVVPQRMTTSRQGSYRQWLTFYRRADVSGKGTREKDYGQSQSRCLPASVAGETWLASLREAVTALQPPAEPRRGWFGR
jgi:hypothetical protein